ncbi:Ig-like domain repeat protein [uncultured Methanobrevibacter sp.]|uniref:Ig-like domain repeat protein n=1 Tax=uncultured Methanobrevibacter sp. TaxID=253161 RepID=UPI0025DFBB3E|nr:Ig-like domain repeat protein [uncultured Methanobrevibacter sp.]
MNKATVTIEPVVTGDKVVDGEVNVTFTLPADVNASSVVVTIDGMPATADLVDGTWVVSFDSLAAGNHTVVVTLTGDTNYKDAVGSATFDIAKVDPEIIIDDIVANVGDYVEVTVTIKGGDATGYLFFNGDLYPVKDGQTTIDVYIEESGIQSIGVFYFGDNKYNNGTALKEFNASKAASTIEINGTEAITTVENATVIVTVGPEGVTGTVNITVDGEAYGEPVEVIDGQAIVEIPGLAAGTHNITAQYTGDDNYNASEVVEMKVVVSLTPTSFEVEGKGAVYNETAYVIVSGLPKDATGTITATIDGKTFTGDAAIGIIEITGLAVGDYELFGVTYSGDSIYNATSGMASIEITPAASFVIIDPIDDVVYNASVEVNYAIENETEITVNVYDADGKLIKEGITIEDDKITISGLNAGKYTIKITNAGDENHTDSFDVETFTVNKATVTIEPVVTGDKVVDGNVNITFTVPKVRDGVVNITIDGNELIGVVIDENGTCTIPGTYGAGNHTVVVTLTGDTNYNDAIGSVTFEVSKVAPETSIDVDDVVAGNDVIITVTVPDDATGAVLLDINGKTYYADIKDGKAELVLSDLPADAYNVEYTYQGDDKYLSDSGKDSFKVSLNDTYKIKAESGAIQVGDAAVIDVLLPEDAAGEVAVTVDNETYSAPVVNGKATVSVPGLPAGDYTADVAYSGDDKYAPSSTTVDIDVAKVPNAPIDAEADPAEVGEDAVVEVTLPADATGNVTVTVNGKNYTVPVEDGKATVSVPGLPAGDYTADVAYSGDDKYEPVSTTAPISVDKVSDVPMDVSADPTEVGEDAVIEVSLPEDATGNVTVTVDGKNYTVPVEDGKATVTVPELPAGEYGADVDYSGDDKYGPVSTTVPVTVDKVSDANVSANADPVEYGEDAVIEVTLPEDATGVVVASVDGELYVADVENGTATINIPNLPAGNHTAEVTYYGDDKYSPVTTTADIEVISEEEVIAPDVVKYYHGSERFIVYVLKDDKGVANKTVSITLNGVTYNRTTDENGIASLGLNINVGNYTALVKVDDTQINATVTIKSTIAADDVIKMFRNGTQYYATFYDSEGNILPNTDVNFNIHGVFYTRKTNDAGVAKLNINLNPGEYIITASNPVTGEMKSNNVTVLSRIVSDDLVKYFRNGSQFVVSVFGDDGKPVGAGENVTFNINGVFYTRQTNASGQAKLNINLNPGSYIVTTVYKGCSQANNVDVLPVLYADDLVKTYGTSDQFKVLLVDGQGLPYPGQTITLNINGVLYNRVTGLDGYAKLNINLMPGQYIITSSYGGAAVSNKVTVKA